MKIESHDFWRVGIDSKGYPCDIRPCLVVGGAAMGKRLFRTLSSWEDSVDPTRYSLFRKLRGVLVNRSLKSAYETASTLKRFVKFADASKTVLSDSTLVQLVVAYARATPQPTLTDMYAIRLLTAEVITLTDNQRVQLFAENWANGSEAKSDWIILISNRQNKTRMDFRRLLISGDANFLFSKWQSLDEKRKSQGLAVKSDRTMLVRALCEEFREAQVSRTLSDPSLGTAWTQLVAMFRWIDEEQHSLEATHVVSTLVSYSHYLDSQRRGGFLKHNGVRNKLVLPVRFMAGAIGLDVFSLKAKLQWPPSKEDGLQTKVPNTEDLQRFVMIMNTISSFVNESLIESEIDKPISIDIPSTKIEFPAQQAEFVGSSVAFPIRNILVTRLRISAELNRFLAATGSNLQVASDITIRDWLIRSNNVITVPKYRAGKLVDIKFTTRYSREIDRYIAFLKTALSSCFDESLPLFPFVKSDRASIIIAHHRTGFYKPKVKKWTGFATQEFKTWLLSNGIDPLTARQLRSVKASWLLRRYKGDSLRTSRAMGNTAQTVFRNYGGQGNHVIAAIELGQFWEVESTLQFSRAPGYCTDTGKPSTDNSSCSDSTTCLRCESYRGEDTLDYIHRMVTLLEVLAVRSLDNEQNAGDIERIEQIISDFTIRHPHRATDVDEIRKSVEELENWHPRFAATLAVLGNVNDRHD